MRRERKILLNIIQRKEAWQRAKKMVETVQGTSAEFPEITDAQREAAFKVVLAEEIESAVLEYLMERGILTDEQIAELREDMSKYVRMVKINAEKQNVTEVWVRDPDKALEKMQSIVGGYVEKFPDGMVGEDLWINEEGYINKIPYGFRMKAWPEDWVSICGNAVFVGSDQEGETISTKVNLDSVREAVVFWKKS